MVSGRDDAFERGSLDTLREAGIQFQELSPAQMKKALAADQFRGCAVGNLRARVRISRCPRQLPGGGRCFRRPGAERIGKSRCSGGRCWRTLALRGLTLSDGSRLKADYYVFACGPWLGKLFPETIGGLDSSDQAGIFFFGPPARRLAFHRRASAGLGRSRRTIFVRHPRQRPPRLQNRRRHARSGIRSHARRASRQAGDAEARSRILSLPLPGPEKRSPDRDPRLPVRANSRQPLHHRPPSTNGKRLANGRRSGHGFKHGPAIGEMMAELILKERRTSQRCGACSLRRDVDSYDSLTTCRRASVGKDVASNVSTESKSRWPVRSL